jgi:PAS domain S-box-containing protein
MKSIFPKYYFTNTGMYVKNTWWAYFIFLTGLGISLAVTSYSYKKVEASAQKEFALVCKDLKSKISIRLEAYALLLRSGSAFFTTKDTITRNEWKQFKEHLKTNKNLPGIQGLGYSMIIPRSKLQQHIKSIQKEGFPEYSIRPVGEREFYTSIIYLEPFEDRNLRAFGYDMFSEPVRRKAMEESRDYDNAALSGKVYLVQETNEDVQSGSLMYVPVYKMGMPSNTVEQRRAAIKGWVYCPFRMNDLMNGILGRWAILQHNRIHLQIFDGEMIVDSSLLFDSQKSDVTFSSEKHIRKVTLPFNFNGKNWILSFTQYQEQYSYANILVIAVFVGGLFISTLLFVLALSLINTKLKSKRIAEQLTSELKKSEIKFKTVAEYTYDWEYWEGKSGEIIFMSPSCERISGYNINEFLSDNHVLRKIIHPDDKKLLEEHTEKTFSTEGNHQTFEIDFRIKKKDGSTAHIGHLCAPVYDENGNYNGRRISNRDITERKIAQDLIAYDKQRLSNIIEGTNAGTWEWNIQTGNVIFNEKWAEFIGYTLDELSPAKIDIWKIYSHPEDLKISGQLLEKHFKGDLNYYEFETRMKHKNGEWIWVLDRGKLHSRDENGNPLLMAGTRQIITKRKQDEYLILRQNNELTKLNRDKDLFISILAHDLKSPFNSMLGFSELLVENVHQFDINKIEQTANYINTSARTAFDLLENLLQWTGSQSGKIPFEPAYYNLSAICIDLMSNFKLIAEAKKITIRHLADQDILVYADLNMLKTVLRNLLTNAIKFTNRMGHIDIYGQKSPDGISITVADNGVGINSEILQNIFKDLHITSTRGTANERGTGLGLMICKDLIEKHGGEIQVESETDKGSVFSINLPYPKKS